MVSKRIIPCLDVMNGRVVKGINFKNIRDMADPVEMAHYSMKRVQTSLFSMILRQA